jgi:hypothetical protein
MGSFWRGKELLKGKIAEGKRIVEGKMLKGKCYRGVDRKFAMRTLT